MMRIKEINYEDACKTFDIISKTENIPLSLSPSIVAIDCKNRNSETIPKYIFFEDGKNIMLYSFVYTAIPIEKFKNYFDIQSPYGYGGPIANTTSRAFWIKAKREFAKWSADNNVVVEFLRFHPIINNLFYQYWIDDKFCLINNRNTISIDLKSPSIISQMRRRFRTYARKWEAYPEDTFSIFQNPSDDQIMLFKSIYINHMQYINASKNYFFSDKYLKSIMHLEKTSLCFVKVKNVIKASIIVFHSKNIVEYFLGCLSNPKEKSNSMLGILTLAATHFSKKYQEFYLGGGRSTEPKDSLLNFKSGMGSIERSYFIGHNFYNKEIYNQIKDISKSMYTNNRVIFYRDSL